MKTMRKLRKTLLIVTALAMLFAQSAFAADTTNNAANYTYTVTLYAGNQGTLNGTTGVGAPSTSTIKYSGSKITITGLKANDQVTLDMALTGAVTLTNAKYYVKGVRESGRDNNTVGNTSFTVTGDADYVVAYGIKGNMVAYTVNYVDANGTSLAASRTYYGNVGDRPVVAYQYIDGYVPNAYNLTNTLSSNEADNVFTFTYSPTPAGATNVTTTTTTVTTGAGTAAAGTTAAAAAGTATAGTTATTGAAAAGTEGTTTGTEGTTTIDQNQTPEALVDIGNNDVPEASADEAGVTNTATKTPVYVGIGIAIAAAAIIVITILYLKKKRSVR